MVRGRGGLRTTDMPGLISSWVTRIRGGSRVRSSVRPCTATSSDEEGGGARGAGAASSSGREARSPALTADGKHILSDVVTSGGVLAGLLLALATGWLWLDPALAIVVALNILREGWHVISESIDGLMDRAAPDDIARAINGTILANAQGAIEVHDIRTRIAGPATFIEFHLIVDAAMTVEQSHVICDRLEHALREQVPDTHPILQALIEARAGIGET